MLGHAEIIVRAPDHDIARAVRRMPDRMRKPAGDALEIGEHAVATLVTELAQSSIEEDIVVHDAYSSCFLMRSPKFSRASVEWPSISSVQSPSNPPVQGRLRTDAASEPTSS